MSGQLQNGEQQFIDANGKPLDGGTVDFYIPNTTTRKNTWQDQALTILNTNPIVLDAGGRAVIWGSGSYRQVLKDKHGILIWDKVVADPISSLSATTGASFVGADDGTGGSIFTTVAGFISSLANSIGSSLVGFIQSGTGAVLRTVQSKLRDTVSVHDFGAIGNGIADDTAAIQAALNSSSNILFPDGTYKFTQLTIPDNRKLIGNGIGVTILTSTTANDGLSNTHPVNGSVAANIVIQDMSIICTNGANVGGGFAQTAASYISLNRVLFQGWKYGVIFDQTEISSIHECQFVSNTTGGIWLVNGPTRTPGANNAFTNRIIISGNQFNLTPVGVIDDGGVTHTIEDNNFNGGQIGVYCAGARAVTVAKNEIEFTTIACVKLSSLRYSDASGVGQNFEVKVDQNFMIATTNTPAIWTVNGTNIRLTGNDMQSPGVSTAYAIQGAANIVGLVEELNDQINFAGKIDAYPPCFVSTDHSGINVCSNTQFRALNKDVTSLEIYAPASNGGNTPIGGMALSANNTSNAKVEYSRISPAIFSNTPGSETGAVNFAMRFNGVLNNYFSMLPGELRPLPDNLNQLGSASFRYTQVFATNGTINTSDGNEKDFISDIELSALAAAKKIKWHKFKFKDAISKKGNDNARWHFGVIAQEVKEAFESEGLDGFKYGVLCYDEWPEEQEILDEDGTVIKPYTPAGSRYGVRYDELFSLKLAAMEAAQPN